MFAESIALNGIDGATGGALFPDLTVDDVARMAQGFTLEPAHLSEVRFRRDAGASRFAVKEGVDPRDLSQAGWGVVFAQADGDRAEAIREALGELLAHRRAQAGERYREYIGEDGYRAGESKQKFLTRHGVGPGPVDPDKVPYYLLLVGSPEAIPYRLQYQLDVPYAVGRLWLESLDDYAAYARSVVAAETGPVRRERAISLFGVRNPDDRATRTAAEHLVLPLAEALAAAHPGWAIETRVGDQARKADLAGVLADPGGPALLFTSSHGMGFPKDDPRQLPHGGALLCQDWPGPMEGAGRPISETEYFSADDVAADARLHGLVSFHYACYGAGTPQSDDFSHRTGAPRREIAPRPFVARLPQRLLAHPGGGALAVVGHVDRAWGCSFGWNGAGRQLTVFTSALKRLLEGHPLGSALEPFNQRYAELAADLQEELEAIEFGKPADPAELAGMWTANNDARNYVLLGDPAVRLAV
jgi:Peptidase family C25